MQTVADQIVGNITFNPTPGCPRQARCDDMEKKIKALLKWAHSDGDFSVPDYGQMVAKIHVLRILEELYG